MRKHAIIELSDFDFTREVPTTIYPEVKTWEQSMELLNQMMGYSKEEPIRYRQILQLAIDWTLAVCFANLEEQTKVSKHISGLKLSEAERFEFNNLCHTWGING